VAAPLESPALGTALGRLAGRCGDKRRPAEPPPVRGGPTIGLTFSGGGFRATFAALGVARYLADAGLLGNVRYLSSVSGGSVANGMLAVAWPDLRTSSFAPRAFDSNVVDPLTARVSSHSLKLSLLRGFWRTIGPRTRTDLLARTFDRWFFHGAELEHLDPACRWIFNAANLTTGVRFGFERDLLGDYVTGLAPTAGTGITVARAAAASAAVPGVFAAMKLKGIAFPCAARGVPALLDGGAYDNTGLEALDSDRYRSVFTVTMNAGGVFVTGAYGKIPLVRDLSRASSLLYRQSTALRARWMVDRFLAGSRTGADATGAATYARRGVLVNLASDMGTSAAVRAWRERFPEHRTWRGEDLAFVPTVFDKLDERLCRALVYRGWWLTGAAFAHYHGDIAPLDPSTTPPPIEGGLT
jgi:NTE family protein